MTGFNDLLEADETGEMVTPTAEAETEGTQDSQEPIPVVEAEKTVPLRALESERGKRQGYENLVAQQQQQIDILMRQIASQQQQQQPREQPAPVDLLLNPDEWQNRLFGAIESVVQQQTFNRTLALSEEVARDKYADYDDLIDGYFKPAAAKQPELVQGLYKAPDPAKYAYKQAKRMKLESEEGELDYDKIKEKLRIEILAELEGKKADLQKQVKVPESLGQVVGSGSTAGRAAPPNGWRASDLYD